MNYLITIIGPTAIGKTALSIALAQHFGCDIISCDSRQFFKEMKIGTAVPNEEELASAPHHFIQNKSIFKSYSVGDFEQEALANSPHELYGTTDEVLPSGDDLHKEKDAYPKAAGGDNPMNLKARLESLYQEIKGR